MEIDPATLTSAARLCTRQGDHADAGRRYLEVVCGRTEALRGVLVLFRAEYAATLDAARAGLGASVRLACGVAERLETFRAEVEGADQAVEEWMRRHQHRVEAAPELRFGPAVGPAGPGGLVGVPGGGPVVVPVVVPVGMGDADGADGAGGEVGRPADPIDSSASVEVPAGVAAHADRVRARLDAGALDAAYDRGSAAAADIGADPLAAHEAGHVERLEVGRHRAVDAENLVAVGSTAGAWRELGGELTHLEGRLDGLSTSIDAVSGARADGVSADAFAAAAGETAGDLLTDLERRVAS